MSILLNCIHVIILDTLESHYVYQKSMEAHTTKREAIIAGMQKMNETLASKYDVVVALQKNFLDEQRILRKNAECTLDKAIEIGDVEVAKIVIAFLEQVNTMNLPK